MRNIKLVVEYNGSGFSGWQKQTGKRTVQGEIETAIFKLTQRKVNLEGSGRTDKGVHALAQVANFQIESEIPTKKIKPALNNLLPSDIRIVKVESVSLDFHSRFCAKKKTYKYVVVVGGEKSAIKHNLMGYFQYGVSLDKMKDASKLIVGKHNFKGFCASATTVSNFEREIYDIKISKKGRTFAFEITGNGFLYNMVRIVVGTLLEVGRGKLSDKDIEKALATGERKYAGQTMPACGLFLKSVEYV